jgi:hypothetical protein
MKKIMLLFVALLLISAVTSAQQIETPAIAVTLLNQEPDPVDTGRYVELRFKIENTRAGSTAGNVEVRLDPAYPFTLDPNENPVRVLGDLSAIGSSNAPTIKFKVRVDENAVHGPNPIRISYRHDNTNWVTREFNIDVQSVDAHLAIISVETVPETIKPGEKATVNILVKNMAGTRMRDITMKLDLTFSSFLRANSGMGDPMAAFNALPFAPLGSTTEQRITQLAAGEEKTFTYNLIAYSDADSKVYKVPIYVTYYDELQAQHIKSDIIGLVVGSQPDMNIVVEDTDLTVGKNSGRVIIRFVNKGFTGIKFLNVETQHTDELDVLSSHNVYLGNVDSDDYDTAEFTVYLKNSPRGERTVHLPLNIQYRDANNNLYEETISLPVEIIDPKKFGNSNGTGSFMLVAVIISAAGGLFLYRRTRKKKTK